jgi:hypothetical protein
LSHGLPQEQAFETVLRDALTTDAMSPTGLYVGTRVAASCSRRMMPESWLPPETLPPVVCVKTAQCHHPAHRVSDRFTAGARTIGLDVSPATVGESFEALLAAPLRHCAIASSRSAASCDRTSASS